MARDSVTAAALGAGAALLLGALVAGVAGLVIAALVVSGLALVSIRARLGSGPRPPRSSRRAAESGDPFRVYRDIQLRLGYRDAGHYGTAVRPMLRRLAAAALAERRRIDLEHDPDAARAAVGEPAWALLDPDVLVSRDGPSLTDIERLARRVEEL
jgi:hypothetical protein